MKAVRLAVVIVMVLGGAAWLRAQTSPNLENGWKPYGSYEGSRLDTVNLMNGNLMLHAPIIPDAPQRGSLKVSYALYGTSKDWQTVCFWNQTTQLWQCGWQKGGGSVNVMMTPATLIVHRTLDYQYSGGQGTTTTEAYGYSITSPDGATHQLHGVAGTEDINGEATQFDSIDLSGFHLFISSSANNGYLDQSTVTDRAGNQYKGTFGGPTNCGRITFAGLSAPGGHAPVFDDAPAGDRYCSQAAWSTLVTDSNGNQISLFGPLNQVPATDTLGKNPPLTTGTATGDCTGCVSSHPFNSSIASAAIYYYQDPNGVTQQIKLCPAEVPIQTAFNQPNPYNPSVNVGEAATPTVHYVPLVSVALADGTYWTFDYDNYGELSSITMPTGGSIQYTWTTVDFHSCASNGLTAVSRAVLTRTLNDGQGHTYKWNYHWGTPSSNSLTNVVTDPANNDTAHIFTALSPGGPNSQGCDFYETSTITYQGLQAANHPLQRVDTTYSSAMIVPDVPGSNVANVFATDVVTTVYPSGKVKKIHKDPDAGLGAGLPIFGNVKKELEYDWGPGAPGALLRETDTVYQWERDPNYLAAGLLDMPASVIIKDAGGNPVAETDYSYDEPGYLTSPTTAIHTQHVTPPNGVRGNQTTVSRWLNTTNSSVSSHTNWYDTGEVYQAIDALGHTTTHTYDPHRRICHANLFSRH
jgi:YD repeat-containing protein